MLKIGYPWIVVQGGLIYDRREETIPKKKNGMWKNECLFCQLYIIFNIIMLEAVDYKKDNSTGAV